MSKSVIFFAQSEFFKDPRVLKESESLKRSGYDVDVVCYQYRFDEYPDSYNGVNIHRIERNSKYDDSIIETIVRALFFISYKFPINAPYKISNFINNRYYFLKRIQFYISYIIKKILFMKLEHRDRYLQYVDPIVYPNDFVTKVIKYLDFYSVFILSNIEMYVKTRNINCNIVHSTDLVTLFAGVLYKYTHKNCKLVYDSHELWIDSLFDCPNFIKKILFYYEMFLIHRTDLVFTVNESIADELLQRYGIKRPTVVLNCPNFEICENLKTDYTNVHVLYQGVFIKERGLENIISCMNHLPNNFHIFIRGFDGYTQSNDGWYIKELKKHALDCGVANKVTFLKPVDMKEMVKNINYFDIGIMPYQPTNANQRFASPNKTFEYMMGGLAIAVSNIPEQIRFVVGNGIGMSFNPDSPEDIANTLMFIARDVNRIEHMKKNALKFAKEKYNWGVQGDIFVKSYNKLF